MGERFLKWLGSVAALQMIAITAVCVLVAGAFGLGMMLGQARQPVPPPLESETFSEWEDALPRRGTYGAIDAIQGNTIRLRDPRSGRIWRVRANRDTVIQFGPRRKIPLQALRPGQRVFVVGAPGANGLDATFIGVVAGQRQRYVVPPVPMCVDCVE